MPGVGGAPGAIVFPTEHARLKRGECSGMKVIYPSDGGPPITSRWTTSCGVAVMKTPPTPVNDVKREERIRATPVTGVKRGNIAVEREEFDSTGCAAKIILPSDRALPPITRACKEDDDSVVEQNPPEPVKRADNVLYQDGKTTGAANPSLSSSSSTGAKIVGIKKLAVLGLVSAGAAACFLASA